MARKDKKAKPVRVDQIRKVKVRTDKVADRGLISVSASAVKPWVTKRIYAKG